VLNKIHLIGSLKLKEKRKQPPAIIQEKSSSKESSPLKVSDSKSSINKASDRRLSPNHHQFSFKNPLFDINEVDNPVNAETKVNLRRNSKSEAIQLV
jgi:hypothetical protein